MRAMSLSIDWATYIPIVGGAMLGGIVILWIVASFYHFRYYVRRAHEPEAWKCQSHRFLRPDQQRTAAIRSTLNLALGGFITGNLVYAWMQGWQAPKLFLDPHTYGWAYTLISPVLYFVLSDMLAYYFHRGLHAKPLFRHIHRYHHKFVATSPWVTTAMHPLEFVILQASAFIPIFVLPIHAFGVAAVLVYALVFNIIDHSGVRLTSRIPWQGPSMYHDDHHSCFHCNFGQHLQIWDRLHGTLRREGRRYGEHIYGGKGEGEQVGEFVRYP